MYYSYSWFPYALGLYYDGTSDDKSKLDMFLIIYKTLVLY